MLYVAQYRIRLVEDGHRAREVGDDRDPSEVGVHPDVAPVATQQHARVEGLSMMGAIGTVGTHGYSRAIGTVGTHGYATT